MGTLLFGVLPGPDIKSLEQNKSCIDGIELRLDYFTKIDLIELKAFLEKCSLPVMLTLRRNDQGGAFQGTEKERLELIESLCVLQPAYVDLEYDVPVEFRKKLFEAYPKILFLSSYHDFKQTLDDLDVLFEKIKTPYAHIYKLAVTAKSSVDALRMLSFVQARNEKIIGISMGEEGKPTRILAPVVGCYLTYASLEATTAPGQLSAQEMQELYRFRKLNRQTSIYAVIGDPVDKSFSPLVHNAVFDQQNINAVYLRMRVKKEELSAFFTLVRKLPFRGFSITMPLKEAVIPFLSEISPQAEGIGSCNTVHICDGKWVGYNTDGIGALDALEKLESVSDKHIVFIGAGGAAKALIFEAAHRGASVTVINRTADKAIAIAKTVKGRGGGWDLLPRSLSKGI